MDDILTRWHAGQRFDEHFSGATEPKLAAVARKIRGRITIPDAVAERLRRPRERCFERHALEGAAAVLEGTDRRKETLVPRNDDAVHAES